MESTATAPSVEDQSPGGLSEEAEALGQQMLADAGEETARADTKASILLATASVAAAAIAGGLYGSDWSTDLLSPVGRVVWGVGWALIAAGILALVAAVYPRRGGTPAAPVTLGYFGDAARMRDASEVEAALDRAARTRSRGTARQLFMVAGIVRRKYALIRAACWLLVIGTAALLLGPALPR